MAEQTDSGQKVNFRQICNAFAIADRSGGQAWPSIQIRCRKSTSDRIETKTTTRIAQYVIQYTEPHPIKRTEPYVIQSRERTQNESPKKAD